MSLYLDFKAKLASKIGMNSYRYKYYEKTENGFQLSSLNDTVSDSRQDFEKLKKEYSFNISTGSLREMIKDGEIVGYVIESKAESDINDIKIEYEKLIKEEFIKIFELNETTIELIDTYISQNADIDLRNYSITKYVWFTKEYVQDEDFKKFVDYFLRKPEGFKVPKDYL